MKTAQEKFDFFEKSINQPVSGSSCMLFLQDELIRSSFINDYTFFQKDANHDLYVNFILKNIKSHDIDLVSDLLSLSIKIGFFTQIIFDKIENILAKNSYHVVKLSSFDYMNCFFHCIPIERYIQISNKVYRNSKNELVIFQACINLFVEDKEKYFPVVLKTIQKKEVPSFNYRLMYNLLEFEHFRNRISKKDVSEIKKATLKQDYTEEIIAEIVSDVNDLVKLIG